MDTVTELNKIRVRAKDGESEYPFLGLHVSATCRHVPFFEATVEEDYVFVKLRVKKDEVFNL